MMDDTTGILCFAVPNDLYTHSYEVTVYEVLKPVEYAGGPLIRTALAGNLS